MLHSKIAPPNTLKKQPKPYQKPPKTVPQPSQSSFSWPSSRPLWPLELVAARAPSYLPPAVAFAGRGSQGERRFLDAKKENTCGRARVFGSFIFPLCLPGGWLFLTLCRIDMGSALIEGPPKRRKQKHTKKTTYSPPPLLVYF